MKSVLIGDIGSTNSSWALLRAGETIIFETSGFNPSLHNPALSQNQWSRIRDHYRTHIDQIYYYGTGVISDVHRNAIAQSCQDVFPGVDIICESDMLGAARALSAGHESIVAILGTGSNSCKFDGTRIVSQIPSLGFPLGDEGGGADLGKACVRAFYYGLMPDDVKSTFADILPKDRAAFLKTYHEHKTANRYLAELVPMAAKHLDSEFIRSILLERFRTFARLHLSPYPGNFEVHMTGGVAYIFRDILKNALEQENLLPGTIVKSPLAGLIEFHKKYDL